MHNNNSLVFQNPSVRFEYMSHVKMFIETSRNMCRICLVIQKNAMKILIDVAPCSFIIKSSCLCVCYSDLMYVVILFYGV